MHSKLTWEKGVFSNTYKIYSKGVQIGYLKDKSFSQSSTGRLGKQEYLFQTKGFFKQKTNIIDVATNKSIGEISYNNWMTKATIIINGETNNWKYNNRWNIKWSIRNSDGVKINYSGKSNGGQIESNTDDALLLLSGLFVTNYYWQMSIFIMIVAFTPIWTTLFN